MMVSGAIVWPFSQLVPLIACMHLMSPLKIVEESVWPHLKHLQLSPPMSFR